jgi:hypothetical protein
LGTIRWYSAKFAPLIRQLHDIKGFMRSLVTGFLWEEHEEGTGEAKKLVRTPSKEAQALVEAVIPVIAPFVMQAGTKWVRENVKARGGVGPEGGGSLLAGLVPKKWQGLADLVLPGIINKFLGGAKQAAGTAVAEIVNPFLGQP